MSTNGDLSDKAQLYCQLDVEAPLVLHQLSQGKPDLTIIVSRMKGARMSVGQKVDIMPECVTDTEPIAQGIITQVGGRG